MASVDPEDEELMRFVFDKDGVVTIPDALTERQLADINALLVRPPRHPPAALPGHSTTSIRLTCRERFH